MKLSLKSSSSKKQKPEIKKKDVSPRVIKRTTKTAATKTSSMVSRRALTIPTKKTTRTSLGKKMKRSSKKALKSMLLSPTFHTLSKVTLGLLVSYGLFYGSYVMIGKSFANEVVISKSEIVSRVSKLTSLPMGEPSDIVRVQDPEDLKKQNAFYKDIEEGDYILIYPTLAVIYNLRSNQVVAVKQAELKREEGR